MLRTFSRDLRTLAAQFARVTQAFLLEAFSLRRRVSQGLGPHLLNLKHAQRSSTES